MKGFLIKLKSKVKHAYSFFCLIKHLVRSATNLAFPLESVIRLLQEKLLRLQSSPELKGGSKAYFRYEIKRCFILSGLRVSCEEIYFTFFFFLHLLLLNLQAVCTSCPLQNYMTLRMLPLCFLFLFFISFSSKTQMPRKSLYF